MCYPYHKVSQALWIDYLSRKGHIINLIAKSKIIRDSDNFLRNLKERCTEAFVKGPPKPSYSVLKRICYELDRSISDLKSERDLTSKIITATTVYQQLIEVYLLKNNKWLFSDKYIMSLLDKNQQEEIKCLTESLIEGISVGNFNKLISMGDDYTDYAKSHPQCSAKSAGVPFFFANYICIQVKYIDEEISDLCCRTIERKLKQSFGKDFFKMLFSEIEGETNPSIIFVCFIGKEENCWKEFMKDIGWQRNIKSYICYPIEIDLHPMIIDRNFKEQLDLFAVFLYQQSQLRYDRICKGDIVGVCNGILEYLLPNEIYDGFKKRLFERHLISAYDTGYLTTTNQLIDAKDRLLRVLENGKKYFSTTFFDECLQQGLKVNLGKLNQSLQKKKHSSIIFVLSPFYNTLIEEIVDHILELVLSIFFIRKEQRCFIYYSLKNI